MTKYETWSLVVQIAGTVIAIVVIVVAVLGEKIRQWLSKPKITLALREPNLTITNNQLKGWYYLLKVENSRRTCPAENVRVWMTKIYKKGPDDSWLEQRFSGPTQVKWQWPDTMPQFLTVGPEVNATFAAVLQGTGAIKLCMYWYPNNLAPTIKPNDPTRLLFKAVSDMHESNEITIEIAWDGKWVEGRTEMAEHLIITQCAV
jgi:hypothetical protein